MKPTLYHFWLSSASWRVRWALAVKGVAFESVMVNIRGGEQHGDAHRARSPLGLVPALTVDGRTLAESVAIIEWLEETVPEPPLFPRDPWALARVRQVVELVNASVQPLQNLAVIGFHSTDPEQQKRFAHHFNQRGMKALERLLALTEGEFGGRFSVGDSLTAADLFVVPQASAARRFGVDLAPFSRVRAVEAAALATPHAEGAKPEHQPGAPEKAAPARP